MVVAMDKNLELSTDKQSTNTVVFCCPRSSAVPPCDKCFEKRCEIIASAAQRSTNSSPARLAKTATHVPLPLSSSREIERSNAFR